MVQISVVNKMVKGVEYEAVCLTVDAPSAVYSVEVTTLGMTRRSNGLVVGEFPIRPSTRELMHAYQNLEFEIECFLQETDDIQKTRALHNMQHSADSVL